MRCAVNHKAMDIVGFVEPWSAPAGDERALALSIEGQVDAVKVRRLDRDGLPELDWPIVELDRPGPRHFPRGSWLHVPHEQLQSAGAVNTLRFELMLTLNEGKRVLIDAGSFLLLIEGRELIFQRGQEQSHLGQLPTRQWLSVELSIREKRIAITSTGGFNRFSLSADIDVAQPNGLTFCSDRMESLPTLNCRLAGIVLEGPLATAAWHFPTLFAQEELVSSGPGIGLRIAGNPTFCVTSARWDGSSFDPRLTPDHYDAIHFHDTDMAALDWPENFAVDVPGEAESGIYAFETVSGEAIERIAFFVTSPKPKAPLLFVVPTATYLAYADEYLPPHLYEWIGTDRGHEFARDNNLRSLYDYHSDTSGVSLTTTRRPKATLRDDYSYPLCGDPHLLPVDLYFLRFAARNGISIDITTDHELHERGDDLLRNYRGVVTGSHPEYLSVTMEQAYRDYIGAGGRLAYLGGNGFAAAVAFRKDVMELRRGPTQPGRTWDGPLGEMALALTNEPGGYLRDRGRGEYRLTGVGISLMGFSKARPFVRTKASRGEDFAWLFDGVVSDSFGDAGIVLGGAAGYEVDCTNIHLGTPENIVVLATASGFSDDYVDDPGKWYEQGELHRDGRRIAEMTYLSHSSGGAVFSASSVCWLGALPGPGQQNDVGRITANLLAHFSR